MYRRLVSIVLLPAVLLTQWVRAGHIHGCHESAGREGIPHVHLSGLWTTAATPEEAQADRCPCCHDDTAGPTPFRCHAGPAGAHDDDAIYLPLSLTLEWHSGPAWNGGADPTDSVLVPLPPAASCLAMPTACLCHPPPLLPFPDCPTYLRTRTLLI